jgi:hypothetical protein
MFAKTTPKSHSLAPAIVDPSFATLRTFAIPIVLGTSAALVAAAPANARSGGGGGSSGGAIVSVHGSPSPKSGILVTHGNLHLPPPPPPVNVVRDHRFGVYRAYCHHDRSACAQGGVIGGTPAPPQGVRGGTVRDHRH